MGTINNSNEEMKRDVAQPAVSVYVVTYNSSKTVIETLESIKEQTYQDIGLIVSDDCSSDDTVKICMDWISRNEERFLFTKILTTPLNTGVSQNVNRAMDACTTEFSKGIAGDDKLLPDCVEKNINYMLAHPQSMVVFSKVNLFGKSSDVRRYSSVFDYSFFSLSAGEQNQRLREKGNCVPAAAAFFRMSRLREEGIRCDERIPMLEDLPLWYTITGKGIKLDFFDEITVGYRVGPGSLTSARIIPYESLVSGRLFRLYYIFEENYKIDQRAAVEKLAKEEVSMLEGSLEYQVGSRMLRLFKRIEKDPFWSFLLSPLRRVWIKRKKRLQSDITA